MRISEKRSLDYQKLSSLMLKNAKKIKRDKKQPTTFVLKIKDMFIWRDTITIEPHGCFINGEMIYGMSMRQERDLYTLAHKLFMEQI